VEVNAGLRVSPGGLPPAPSRAPATGGGTWRRARRIATVAAAAALLVPLISYVSTMMEPSDSSLGIRSVEWLRDHGAAGLVSQVEAFYYSLTAPAKGGPTLRALPAVGFGVAQAHAHRHTRIRLSATSASSSASVAPALAQPAIYLPHRVAPLMHPALRGEGVWLATRPREGSYPPLMVTTFRPDPNYPRLVAGVAWIDTHRTTVTLYPGRMEPSVPIPRGAMEVPMALRPRLLASFNSGFKLSDARGGFALHGHTYAPLQSGEATLVRYADGRVDVTAWSGGPQAPRDVVFARQNLPLIVDHGRPNPNLSDGPEWGATLGNAIRVWRSGIGVDRHGNLIYAAANYQTVGSLAAILKHAGAVRAMELDINDYWVSFITYRRAGAGAPSNLLPSMVRPATRYLSPEDRDFFAVYTR
jgi:phosphodiester glycosidase